MDLGYLLDSLSINVLTFQAANCIGRSFFLVFIFFLSHLVRPLNWMSCQLLYCTVLYLSTTVLYLSFNVSIQFNATYEFFAVISINNDQFTATIIPLNEK